MAYVLSGLATIARIDTMSILEQVYLGFCLFFLGTSYRFSAIGSLDQKFCLKLHCSLRCQPWISVFHFLWPFGTTVATLGVIAFLVLITPIQGISAGLAFLIFAGIDRLVKILFRRCRPFNIQPGTMMVQPRRPSDPSFPSGDTFHIWFTVLTLVQVFHLPIFPAIGLAILAVLVSLGRIALGVHYPLDVLAGAGLGIAGAGMGTIIHHFLAIG